MTLDLRALQTRKDVGLTRRDDHPATQRQTIIIATGFECSYPTVQGGRRRDELEETGHYQHWAEDFQLCRDVGARYVRYGLPYYKTHLGPGRYDWSFADEVLPAMWNAGLIPIADLCHFGVPDWIGSFQNTDWPTHFAEYARAFAERYPWIKFYTPVNEMLVCARFSGKEGAWNEQEKSDRAMVQAHTVMCRATLLAIPEILKLRPDAVFIQSEIAEAYLESCTSRRADVDFYNQFRFITFDHIYGRPLSSPVLHFLYDNGWTEDDYHWFMQSGRTSADHCVLGMDYYGNNEKILNEDGSETTNGTMLGWHAIARDYYTRYHRPMMMTETNAIDNGGDEAVRWLEQTWHQAHHLRREGVPVIGYTWYSLTDQVDWDIQIREIRGKVTPNGLYDLDRKPRPVADTFRRMAKSYGGASLVDGLPIGLVGC